MYKNNPFFLNSIYIMHFSKADTVIHVLVNALLMEVFGEVCEAVVVVCLHFIEIEVIGKCGGSIPIS